MQKSGSNKRNLKTLYRLDLKTASAARAHKAQNKF